MVSACVFAQLRRHVGAPRARMSSPMLVRRGARKVGLVRGMATEGGEGAQHWSKDKAKTSAIKQYGTIAMIGAFAAGLSWRTYQWSAGTLPDTTLSGKPKNPPVAAAPTEEALAAATKKSVVHWEGEARPPVGLASERVLKSAPPAPAAEQDEPDPPAGSAKEMKLAHDLEQINKRLSKVQDKLNCPLPKVVTHVALLKLKPEATAADKEEIVAGLRRLPSQIPQIAAFRAGEDLGLDPSGRSIALVGEFASVEDYKTYAKHDAHVGLIVSKIKPLLAERTACQFEHSDSETYVTGTKCGVTHVVILKLDDVAAAPAIIEQLRKLPEQIGQIQEYRMGMDMGIDPSGQTLAVVGSFKCKGCYGGYAKNADHQTVIADYIKPALAAGGRAAAQIQIVL